MSFQGPVRSPPLVVLPPSGHTELLSYRLELPSVTWRHWGVKSRWDDSVQEISGVYPPSGVEGSKESHSKAFPESTRLLLSSLDIYKQGTTRVNMCLLALNDRDIRIMLKSSLIDRSTYGLWSKVTNCHQLAVPMTSGYLTLKIIFGPRSNRYQRHLRYTYS